MPSVLVEQLRRNQRFRLEGWAYEYLPQTYREWVDQAENDLKTALSLLESFLVAEKEGKP